MYSEIDLLMMSPDKELIAIEVKSCTDFTDMNFRPLLGAKQWGRLTRAFEHMRRSTDMPFKALIAAVNQYGEIQIFPFSMSV